MIGSVTESQRKMESTCWFIPEEGVKAGINPFDNGSAYTDIMKTQALKQALTKYGFTAAFGGGRRDEEKSQSKRKESSLSVTQPRHGIRRTRGPEMWKLYNTKIQKGESMRVFPISNWTEKDIWQYIQRENIEIVPLYFAKERPVIYRDGNIIMVDDDRLKLRPDEKIEYKKSDSVPLDAIRLQAASNLMQIHWTRLLMRH